VAAHMAVVAVGLPTRRRSEDGSRVQLTGVRAFAGALPAGKRTENPPVLFVTVTKLGIGSPHLG